uniref:Uncharacterized protein n=1 Tax=Octactis speculum TaxID=3111310 RepID=A0A7S2F6Q4_9STRA
MNVVQVRLVFNGLLFESSEALVCFNATQTLPPPLGHSTQVTAAVTVGPHLDPLEIEQADDNSTVVSKRSSFNESEEPEVLDPLSVVATHFRSFVTCVTKPCTAVPDDVTTVGDAAEEEEGEDGINNGGSAVPSMSQEHSEALLCFNVTVSVALNGVHFSDVTGTFIYYEDPKISSTTVGEAAAGDVVTIKGTGLIDSDLTKELAKVMVKLVQGEGEDEKKQQTVPPCEVMATINSKTEVMFTMPRLDLSTYSSEEGEELNYGDTVPVLLMFSMNGQQYSDSTVEVLYRLTEEEKEEED